MDIFPEIHRQLDLFSHLEQGAMDTSNTANKAPNELANNAIPGSKGSAASRPTAQKSVKLPVPPTIKNGWFTETETFWPGQKFSLALEEFSNDKAILFHEHSGFQEVLVFQSAQYGTTLVLDGVIQLTERDEFAYHETMTHLPMCSHPNPRRVLIVGGGDGGILREVCRHDCVEEIVMVEIDVMVIQVCQKYFRESTAVAFQDPRLTIAQADAAIYLENHELDYFDIILGDTSDPGKTTD